MCHEQIMIDDLNNNCPRVNLIHHNVHKNPDVSFVVTIRKKSYYCILEAKKYNKFNKSNYPKQLLSEILINKKLYCNNAIVPQNNAQPSFGILLSFDGKKHDRVYGFLQNHIDNDDWTKFGRIFNCKFVFFYDQLNHNLYYQSWNTVLKKLKPRLY